MYRAHRSIRVIEQWIKAYVDTYSYFRSRSDLLGLIRLIKPRRSFT
jgi:hypothetical protein